MYLQAPYLDAHSARPGCFGNGKPVYVSDKTDDEEGVAPYLYSPARRNSWLVGTDPCMGNGWVEVRTSAERAEHIQAGASGPWQEFNGTGWVRSAGIRALPHCGTASDDCLYVSGTKHQQHTHGIYARTSMLCDGKPVSTSSARATTPLSRPPCPPCTPLAPRLHPAHLPPLRPTHRSTNSSRVPRIATSPRQSWRRVATCAPPTSTRPTHHGCTYYDYAYYARCAPSTSTRRSAARAGWSAETRASPRAGSRYTRARRSSRVLTASGASTCQVARGRPTPASSCSCTRCRMPSRASECRRLMARRTPPHAPSLALAPLNPHLNPQPSTLNPI